MEEMVDEVDRGKDSDRKEMVGYGLGPRRLEGRKRVQATFPM